MILAGLLGHPVQCGRCTTATWAGSPGALPSSTRCPSMRRPGGWSGWRGAGGVLTWGTYLDHIHHVFRSNVVSAARAAVAEGEHQWGLQLLDMILDSEVQQASV